MVVAIGRAAKVVAIGLGKNWFGRVHTDANNAGKGKALGGGHCSNRAYTAGVFGRNLENSKTGGSALLLPPDACFAPDLEALTDPERSMYKTLVDAHRGKADIATVTSAN